MKYHHRFHAGNFADVHKHIALLALLAALRRKDKGFLFLDTHAGAGQYDLGDGAAEVEWRAGAARLWQAPSSIPEITAYQTALRQAQPDSQRLSRYPGSPLLATQGLRPQDRVVLIEAQPDECERLSATVRGLRRVTAQCADGYQALKSLVPPVERRGLIFLDPPYEEAADFERVGRALSDGLERFATGVYAAWLPVKHAADLESWWQTQRARLAAPLLLSQLWLYPRDNRARLTGSALLIANPPYQLDARMRVWLPIVTGMLSASAHAGSEVRTVGAN